MLTARPHTPPLKSINQILNIKGESNKAKGNQSVLKLLLLAFSLLDGTYQDCSFLLLSSHYYVIIIIIIIIINNSSLEWMEELLVYFNVFKTPISKRMFRKFVLSKW